MLKVDEQAGDDICWADHPWNLALRHKEDPTSQRKRINDPTEEKQGQRHKQVTGRENI